MLLICQINPFGLKTGDFGHIHYDEPFDKCHEKHFCRKDNKGFGNWNSFLFPRNQTVHANRLDNVEDKNGISM